MESRELSHIIAAILVLTTVTGFAYAVKADWLSLSQAFLFSVIIISVSIAAKKITAYLLDSDVEHEIWTWSRYGFKPKQHLEKEIPAGVIFPLLFTLLSAGALKVMSILTYETRATQYRAAKRFGFYSYTEMTDWHNALIGAGGIIAMLLVSLVSYFLPYNLEFLSKIAAYYAFFNMLPISKLDGTQIFFGSRVLYATLAIITAIFAGYFLTILA